MTRIRTAFNVLRGRPTAYRLTILGGMRANHDLMANDCVFRPVDPDDQPPAIWIGDNP